MRRHRAEGALHFVDLFAEVALDRAELLARAADDPIQRDAGLAQTIENLAQLVAHTLAGRGQRRHRRAGVALDRFAERRARLLDLVPVSALKS